MSHYSCSATFYTQNGNEGACGKANSDDAHICALFTSVYDGGKHCGDQILVTNLKNGKTLPVTVAGMLYRSLPSVTNSLPG
jgi:hypothetical protein